MDSFCCCCCQYAASSTRVVTIARRLRNATTAALVGWSLGLLTACDQGTSQAPGPSPIPSVTVAKPVVKDIVEWDEFVGRFDAVDFVEVRARVGGYLESVH